MYIAGQTNNEALSPFAHQGDRGSFEYSSRSYSRPPSLIQPTSPMGAAWPSGVNFVWQIVSEKSIKSDPCVRLCNFWNQSAGGLVWICNSTPFIPLKRNQSVSITLCSHLRARKPPAPRCCHLESIMLLFH